MTRSGANVIVTDKGFGPDNWSGSYLDLSGEERRGSAMVWPAAAGDMALDLLPDADLSIAGRHLSRWAMIRVNFPSFSDGRGFTIARRLRLMGFRGRLRAAGYVIADQYGMLRRSGFDEVEISTDLAARQPEASWRFRADWHDGDYQARLRGDHADAHRHVMPRELAA